MVLHICKNCDYTTKLKGNMRTHLNKKNKCYETEIIHDGVDHVSLSELNNKNETENEYETILEKQTQIINELTKTNLDHVKKIDELTKLNDEYYDFIENRDDIIQKLKDKVEKYKSLSKQINKPCSNENILRTTFFK